MCGPLHPVVCSFMQTEGKSLGGFGQGCGCWRWWRLGCLRQHLRNRLLWHRRSRASGYQWLLTRWGLHGPICKGSQPVSRDRGRCFQCGSADHLIHNCLKDSDGATCVPLNSKEGTAMKGGWAPQRNRPCNRLRHPACKPWQLTPFLNPQSLQ